MAKPHEPVKQSSQPRTQPQGPNPSHYNNRTQGTGYRDGLATEQNKVHAEVERSAQQHNRDLATLDSAQHQTKGGSGTKG